jgi:uncharacterized membrane protein required for colicin V production
MEPFVTILICLFLIAYMRVSVEVGLFHELTNMLSLLTGLWVALRYWYPVTAYLHGKLGGSSVVVPAGNAALVAFWALMLASALPLLLVFNRLDERFIPRYPRTVDAASGLVCGVGTSLIVVCGVMMSVSVFAPKIAPSYDRDTLLVPWDRLPITAYRRLESGWLGMTNNAPGKTRFPTFDKENVDDFDSFWK